MTTIHVLFLDNDKSQFEALKRSMTAYWTDLFNETLFFKYVQKIEDAMDALRGAEKYQMFIADVLFPPMEDPGAKAKEHVDRGFEATRFARQRNEKMLILAISVGKTAIPDMQELAKNNGAHLFRFRSQMSSTRGAGVEGLCKNLRAEMLNLSIIADPTVLEYNQDDPRLEYIVSEVGESTVKSLYNQILSWPNPPTNLTASYLAPGLSGAFVLQVEARGGTTSPTLHLLKVSQSRERLGREIKNYPAHAPYSNRLLVRYLTPGSGEVAHAGDWFGIGATFEKNAVTMRDWLQQSWPRQTVEAVMHSLFLDNGLTNGYGTDLRKQRPPQKAIAALTSSVSRRARIFVTLDELCAVLLEPEFVDEPNWRDKSDQLKRLVRSGQLVSITMEEMPPDSYACLSHGDLHSQNILVTGTMQRTPILIDTAEFGVHHWTTDYVRLIADLVFGVVDAGVQSYHWKHVATWRGIAASVCNLDVLAEVDGDPNLSVKIAINWLIRNVARVCPAFTDHEFGIPRPWELQLALAVEFLRVACHIDLSPPKRVAALLAAHDALVMAETTLRGARA